MLQLVLHFDCRSYLWGSIPPYPYIIVKLIYIYIYIYKLKFFIKNVIKKIKRYNIKHNSNGKLNRLFL